MNELMLYDLIGGPTNTSIIIGENGSGKSRLLNTLAKRYVADGYEVIGIANSIHDKFTLRSSKFHFLGARSGRNISKNTIKKAIRNISSENVVQLKQISQILSYVGYSGKIGIKLNGLLPVDKYKLEEAGYLSKSEKQNIHSLVAKYYDLYEINRKSDDGVLWLGVDDFNFDQINKSIFSRFIELEAKLKKLGCLKSIEIILNKNGCALPLSQASSGELSFITSMIYLATVIDERTVILIDEPENSLHPSWQKEYLGKLLDLFHYYQAKIVIATHSPLIVSGAENTDRSVRVFKSELGELTRLEHEANDLESLMWSLFSVTTPESRYMSNFFVKTLNDLGENKIGLDEVMERVDAFEGSSYNDKQIQTLAGIRDIALKIQSRKVKG